MSGANRGEPTHVNVEVRMARAADDDAFVRFNRTTALETNSGSMWTRATIPPNGRTSDWKCPQSKILCMRRFSDGE